MIRICGQDFLTSACGSNIVQYPAAKEIIHPLKYTRDMLVDVHMYIVTFQCKIDKTGQD